jgi:hypothetical protein
MAKAIPSHHFDKRTLHLHVHWAKCFAVGAAQNKVQSKGTSGRLYLYRQLSPAKSSTTGKVASLCLGMVRPNTLLKSPYHTPRQRIFISLRRRDLGAI